MSEPILNSEESHDEARLVRNRNIKLSVGISLLSKVVGIAIAFGALPLASRALGTVFGVYAAISTVMNVMSTANFGIGPGITQALAPFATNRNEQEERSWVASAFALVGVSVLVLVLLAAVLFAFVPLWKIFGEDFKPFSTELRSGYVTLVILAAMLNLVSVSDSSYIGYLQDYKFKMYSLAGFILSLLLLFVTIKFVPTLVMFLVAMYAAPLIPRIYAAFRLIFVERPYLRFNLSSFSRLKIKTLLSTNLAHTAMQLGELATLTGGTLIVTNIYGVESAGRLGGLISWLAMVASLRVMILNPVWPGMKNAWSSHDYGWMHRTLNKAWMALMGMGVIVAGLIAFIGLVVFNRLYDVNFHASQQDMTALAVASLLTFTEALLYHLFIAIDRNWYGSLATLVRGIIAFGSAWILIPQYGTGGFFWSMSLGLVVSTIVMLYGARHELRTIYTGSHSAN